MYHASMVDRMAHTVHQLLENLITQHMYNRIVSFTRPISICLRIIIIIKLKKFKAKATFWQKLPYAQWIPGKRKLEQVKFSLHIEQYC